MKIAARIAAAVLVVSASLAGCSTPPGPAPASPAPKLPAEAIAYDELKSTDRKFPFTGTCTQLTEPVLTAVGAKKARNMNGKGGCSLAMNQKTLQDLWIEVVPPPNESVPRAFPLVWNGSKGYPVYHQRLVLDGRYYAVAVVEAGYEFPTCILTVDTGSPIALSFRGIVPDEYGKSLPVLNPSKTGNRVDYAGVRQFATDQCPAVEKLAVQLLNAIDPNGGSLATT